jgi:hypothetical protein
MGTRLGTKPCQTRSKTVPHHARKCKKSQLLRTSGVISGFQVQVPDGSPLISKDLAHSAFSSLFGHCGGLLWGLLRVSAQKIASAGTIDRTTRRSGSSPVSWQVSAMSGKAKGTRKRTSLDATARGRRPCLHARSRLTRSVGRDRPHRNGRGSLYKSKRATGPGRMK